MGAGREGPCLAVAQQGTGVLGGEGIGKMEALSEFTIAFHQERVLFRCFHAHGRDFQPQGMCEGGDGFECLVVAFLLPDGRDKRGVDFQFVDGIQVQVAERRVAGSEIVNAQMDVQVAQLIQQVARLPQTLHDNAFGDLQMQALGRQIIFFQGRL